MKFAVSRLHLPDGTLLFNQVIEEVEGQVVAYFPLVEELAQTEWRGGDFYLSKLLYME